MKVNKNEHINIPFCCILVLFFNVMLSVLLTFCIAFLPSWLSMPARSWPAGELVTMRMRLSSVVVKYVSDVVQCAGHYDPTATRVAVGV